MIATRPLRLLLAAALVAGGLSSAQAQNWPNWRGPNHNGSTSVTGLPDTFSKEENVSWVVDLPGAGAGTPVVWDDAIFVSCTNEEESGIIAVKINAKSGEIEWTHKFGEGIRQDDRSDYAGPSAVTDGTHAWFFTGKGDLACYDFNGRQVWHRNIQSDYGPFAFGWTFSTTPLVHKGTLYLQVLQRDVAVDGKGFTDKENESYLLALDPETGAEKWRQIRPSEAVMESREAFTSPVPVTHNGREEIVVVGGDCLTGHDPATGEELWRWGTWNPGKEPFWRLVPSPVYGEGAILACGPKGQPVYAIKAGGKGTLLDTAKMWVSEGKEVTSDVPTPLFYDGYFYILNGRNRFLTCVHPTTGDVVWSERVDAKTKLESSPTASDGKIYFISHLGETFVYKAGREPGLIHQTMMGEDQSVHVRASIVPANGALFIRTDTKLYCVKK